jgi:hypothetical protein
MVAVINMTFNFDLPHIKTSSDHIPALLLHHASFVGLKWSGRQAVRQVVAYMTSFEGIQYHLFQLHVHR